MNSKPKVAILDYGLGNIFSILQACQCSDMEGFYTASPKEVAVADGLILPGVGAFGEAMARLQEQRKQRRKIESVASVAAASASVS